MNMLEWAKSEVEYACKKERGNAESDDWDYGCACYEGALAAFEVLCNQGHSGMSIGITKQILNRLIDGKCLTPIEDTDDVWVDLSDQFKSESDIVSTYQCKRMSSLFKDVYNDGHVVYTDTERQVGIENDNSFHFGLIAKMCNEMFPITMPYSPSNTPYKFYAYSYVWDGEKEIQIPGEFNSIRIDYVITPDGLKIDINRLFREDNTGRMKEISLFQDNVETNGLGTNVKIHFHLDENNLKDFGFKYIKSDGYPDKWSIPPHWHFHQYLLDEITFNIDYYIEPYKEANLEISVIDESFGQPYDYQHILSKNPSHKFAKQVFDKVEKIMQKLTDSGIISGHIYGEYI